MSSELEAGGRRGLQRVAAMLSGGVEADQSVRSAAREERQSVRGEGELPSREYPQE